MTTLNATANGGMGGGKTRIGCDIDFEADGKQVSWLKLPFWPCVAYMAIGKFARYVTMTAALVWVF